MKRISLCCDRRKAESVCTRQILLGAGTACRWRLLPSELRREQVFSPSERKEVMYMNLHDWLMAAMLALNLLLEYIAQHKKR